MTMRAASRLASMPGIRASSSALAVVACAAALAACGGDDEGGPIPQEAGDQLIDQLDQIQTLVNDGLCDEAQQTAVSFATGVNELPEEVGGELRDRLVDASGNLESLTTDQCTDAATGATGETGEVPPETTEEPTTPEETTEPTTTEEEEPPPEEDDGGGPPADKPGNGDPGGGNEGGGNIGGDEGSGGIGSGG
jgi:hypothetical protein